MPRRTPPAQEDVTAGNRRVRDADVEATGGLVKEGTSDCAKDSQSVILPALVPPAQPERRPRAHDWISAQQRGAFCLTRHRRGVLRLPVSYTHLRAHETPEHLV